MTEHRGLKRKRIWVLLTAATGIVLSTASPARAFHSFTIPASENGCAVDLQVESEHLTDRVPIGNGDITMTNLDTGATYLQRSRYTETVTFDASTGSQQIELVGNIWIQLFPGDAGPSGVVQEPGAELLVSGRLNFTLNEQGVLTAFSLNGMYQDLCALLSD
jgi:hypothetical protein